MSEPNPVTAGSLARQSLALMVDGSLEQFRAIYHLDAVNHEPKAEPPTCRVPGPDGFYATARWLRAAFDPIAIRVEHVVVEGDLVVAGVQMSGRQTGTMVTYRPDGSVERAFAPTNRRFSARQAHFLRVRGGLLVEHWAVRDDLGQAVQLGWLPPSPRYLIRCAVATRFARRELAAARRG